MIPLSEQSDHDLLIRLSALTEAGFSRVEKRFDDQEARVEKRLDDHEMRLRGLDRRVWLAAFAATLAGASGGWGLDKLIGG